MWDVTATRAPASGINGSWTGVVSGEQRASIGGSASGTVRTETFVGMAREANMFFYEDGSLSRVRSVVDIGTKAQY